MPARINNPRTLRQKRRLAASEFLRLQQRDRRMALRATEFTPVSLFASGEQGVWYERQTVSDFSATQSDLSGNGSDATLVGDSYTVTLSDFGADATVAYATPENIVIVGSQAVSGEAVLDDRWLSYIILDRALTAGERQSLVGWMQSRGAAEPDFFVNSVSGSDANDGSTADAAFSTLAKAEAEALALGDGAHIALAAGSEWREQLDLSTLDGVKVAGYGSLSSGLPVIRGDDLIGGVWDTSTDRADANANTYSISWTHAIQAGSANGGPVVYENEGLLQWQSTIADVDANPGSYYHDGATSDESPVTLYVHPTGSTNPNVDGGVYEATRRHTVCRVGNNARCGVFRAHAAGDSLGSLVFGKGGLANGVLATGNPVHDINGKTGIMRHCVAWHPHRSNGFGMLALEFFDEDPALGTAEWDRCVVVGPPGEGSMNMAAFGGHNTPGGQDWASWAINDCSAKNADIAFEDTREATAQRLRMENGSILVTTNESGGGITTQIMDAEIIASESINSGRSYLIQNTGDAALTIEGLRAYLGYPINGVFNNPKNLTLSKSAISISSTAPALVMNSGSLQMDVAIDSTVFEKEVGALLFDVRNYMSAGGSLSSNNNVLHDLSLASYRAQRQDGTFGTFSTLSQIQSNTTEEANSSDADPAIASPATGDWSINGSVGGTGAGLERPSISYTPIPATLSDAETWIIKNAE